MLKQVLLRLIPKQTDRRAVQIWCVHIDWLSVLFVCSVGLDCLTKTHASSRLWRAQCAFVKTKQTWRTRVQSKSTETRKALLEENGGGFFTQHDGNRLTLTIWLSRRCIRVNKVIIKNSLTADLCDILSILECHSSQNRSLLNVYKYGARNIKNGYQFTNNSTRTGYSKIEITVNTLPPWHQNVSTVTISLLACQHQGGKILMKRGKVLVKNKEYQWICEKIFYTVKKINK